MVSIVVRTVIIYALLLFALRIMGKRQLGELDAGELVSALLISEFATIPIDDPDIPLVNAILPILLILSLEILLSTIKNKSEKLKHTIEGHPTYIIYKGRLLQNALVENRISINEILSEIRSQGIGDMEEVGYAILEQNGTLSVLKKSDGQIAHSIVIDGEIIKDTLLPLGYNEKWLERKLEDAKLSLKEVFLMTVTESGETKIIRKDGKDK